MIRRPPRSTRTDTLFPYTTLFRSEPDNTPIVGAAVLVVLGPSAGEREVSPGDLALFPLPDLDIGLGCINQLLQPHLAIVAEFTRLVGVSLYVGPKEPACISTPNYAQVGYGNRAVWPKWSHK